MTDENHTPKKRYGLTDERKRRKAEYEREEFEKLPWNIPMQFWESSELNTYNRHFQKKSFQLLDAQEQAIKNKNNEE